MSQNINNVSGGGIDVPKRSSNFELLRILAMLSILIGHAAGYAIMPEIVESVTAKSTLYYILWSLSQYGVQIFVLLTGYFMITSNTKWRSFFRTLFEVIFYSWSLFIIFAIFRPEFLTKYSIIISLFPFGKYQYWFMTNYLVLYLFIPYINLLVKNFKKPDYQKLVLTLFILSFILKSVNLDYAFSYLMLFITLYLIGGYIKLYGFNFLEKRRNCFLIIISYLLIVILWRTGCLYLFKNTEFASALSMPYSFLLVFATVSIFYLFKNLKLKYNKIINTIAISSLSAYLITENFYMRKVIWTKWFNLNGYYTRLDAFSYLLYFFLIVIGAFLACILLDKLRIKVIEPLMFSILEKICSIKKINIKK